MIIGLQKLSERDIALEQRHSVPGSLQSLVVRDGNRGGKAAPSSRLPASFDLAGI
jgi:hypothetical protein